MKTEQTQINKYEYDPIELVFLLNLKGKIQSVRYNGGFVEITTESKEVRE